MEKKAPCWFVVEKLVEQGGNGNRCSVWCGVLLLGSSCVGVTGCGMSRELIELDE